MAKKFLTDIDLTGNSLLNPSNIYTKSQEDTAHGLLVPKTTTVNGHALSGNVTVTSTDVGLSAVTNDAQVKRTEMGTANGVATLDATSKIPASQLPSSIVGALVYQGVWDASTNIPTITNGVGTKGFFYKVSNAGATTIDGNNNWTVGDIIAYDGTTWDKIEGGGSDVSSVAGRVGAVVLTTADVATSANKNYVTDAQAVVLGNTSNTNTGDETLTSIKAKLGITVLSGPNTGDQTITLTGDVTGSGAGSFVATVGANAITLGKMAQLGANTFIGNNTGASANPIALTVAQVQTMLSLSNTNTGDETTATIKTKLGITTLSGSNTGDQTITLTGDVTGSGTGSFAATIGAGAITLAKMANVAAGTVFYRKTASTGAPEVQTLATLKTDLGLTGTNSGDQTITLTGDVTGSGTGSFSATVGAGSITLAKMASLAANSIMGNNTGAAATPLALTAAQVKTFLAIQGSDVAGNISGNAANVTGTIAIANGGTGQTTATASRTALGATGKYAVLVGNGALTTITVNHNLNTVDVGRPACWEVSTGALVEPDFTIVDANNITVTFGTAPTANQYKVVVVA